MSITSKDKEIWSIIETVSNEKNISQDILHDAISEALLIAVKKHLGDLADIEVIINKENFKYGILRKWLIVDDNKPAINFEREIPLRLLAQKKTATTSVIDGKNYLIEELPKKDFGRIAINAARSIINQIIKTDIAKKIVDKFKPLLYTIVQAEVKKLSKDKLLVDLIGHDAEAVIYRSELMTYDRYRLNDCLRACIVKVSSDASGGYQILLSRTHKKMLQALCELEVPEIAENIIEIVDIARDPGVRSKIAVRTSDRRLDLIGACVGVRGFRVQAISKELNNERVDIVKWDPNPAQYVMNALHSDINFISIKQDELTNTMHVVVPEDRVAQAIGIGGQNVALASLLTSWKIQIISDKTLEQKTEEQRQIDIKKLQQTLNITVEQATKLVDNLINTLDNIELSSPEDIARALGCDLDYAHVIKEEATTALLIEELQMETSDTLASLEGINQDIVKQLQAHQIYEIKNLAALGVDELQDIVDIDRQEAARLIMSARRYIGKV